MPGSTPVFGIPYPCAGETIDPSVFQDFADAVDAAMTTVDNAAYQGVLVRPSGAVRTPLAGTSVAVGGALTAIVYSDTATDFQSGVTPVTNGIQVDEGVWEVTAEFSPLTTVTSVTSFAAEIQRGGTTVYRRKLGFSTGGQTNAVQLNISGLVHCTAATNNLTGHWSWTGSGGPMFVYSRLSVNRICVL